MKAVIRKGRTKSEEKRAAILEAAGELFIERGFQGTSMDAVAELAGVSKQTVYSHFDNKNALFKACIKAKVESYGFSDQPEISSETLRSALEQAGARFLELLFDPKVVAMHRVVIAESANHPALAQAFYDNGRAVTIGTIAKLLRNAAERGLLRVDDPHYAAVQFLNMACGEYHLKMMLNLIERVPRETLCKHIRTTVDDFLKIHETAERTQ